VKKTTSKKTFGVLVIKGEERFILKTRHTRNADDALAAAV
jgi:hypothetical protein